MAVIGGRAKPFGCSDWPGCAAGGCIEYPGVC